MRKYEELNQVQQERAARIASAIHFNNSNMLFPLTGTLGSYNEAKLQDMQAHLNGQAFVEVAKFHEALKDCAAYNLLLGGE